MASLDWLRRLLPTLSNKMRITLREQEKILTLFAIYTRLTPPGVRFLSELSCMISVFRIKAPTVFKMFSELETNYDELINSKIPSLVGGDYWSSEECGFLEGQILSSLDKNKTRQTRINRLGERLKEYQERSEYSESYQRAMNIYDGFVYAQTYHSGAVKSILSKLEFAVSFVTKY